MESISARSIFRKSYKTDILALSIKKVKKKKYCKSFTPFYYRDTSKGKNKREKMAFHLTTDKVSLSPFLGQPFYLYVVDEKKFLFLPLSSVLFSSFLFIFLLKDFRII